MYMTVCSQTFFNFSLFPVKFFSFSVSEMCDAQSFFPPIKLAV